MKWLGINENEAGKNIISSHFNEIVQSESNILQRFSKISMVFMK
jgi:hypothetical protein